MAPSHRAMQPRPPKQDQLYFLRISGSYLQNCHHGRSTAAGSAFCWMRRPRCDERHASMMTKVTEPTFLL